MGSARCITLINVLVRFQNLFTPKFTEIETILARTDWAEDARSVSSLSYRHVRTSLRSPFQSRQAGGADTTGPGNNSLGSSVSQCDRSVSECGGCMSICALCACRECSMRSIWCARHVFRLHRCYVGASRRVCRRGCGMEWWYSVRGAGVRPTRRPAIGCTVLKGTCLHRERGLHRYRGDYRAHK